MMLREKFAWLLVICTPFVYADDQNKKSEQLTANGNSTSSTEVVDQAERIGPPVPIYTEGELIKLFEKNVQLKRVKDDSCQLVQDIRARAVRVSSPAYEFLYGDMLAWGVCIEQDAKLGLYYMEKAAQQAFPAALEQLGRYYRNGTLVQQDHEKAVLYMREAASMGYLNAQIGLAELLLQNYGSPHDYEAAYSWLYHAVVADKALHAKVTRLRKGLADRMPNNIVERAKKHKTL